MQTAVDMFVACMEIALPIAVVFECGQLIVNTVLRTAFGGRLQIGR